MKAHRPYESSVKVSAATTLNHSEDGQFIAHLRPLPGNLYDAHTLVIREIETRVVADGSDRATARRATTR